MYLQWKRETWLFSFKILTINKNRTFNSSKQISAEIPDLQPKVQLSLLRINYQCQGYKYSGKLTRSLSISSTLNTTDCEPAIHHHFLQILLTYFSYW